MNSFNGPRARDGRQPITGGLCKYRDLFRPRLAAAPALPRLLAAYWAGTRLCAALIGRGACPSAPAPSGCRRGGGRSMRRVTLFVNGSARNGKVRPGWGWPAAGPAPHGPPARTCPPRSLPGQPGLRRAVPEGSGARGPPSLPVEGIARESRQAGICRGWRRSVALGSRVRLLLSGTACGMRALGAD